MDAAVPSSTITLMAIACALSLAALFYLFQKHVAGDSLLPYETRRRVPWNFGVVLLAMGMPLLGVVAYLSREGDLPEEIVPAETLLLTGWGNFAFMILFIVGVTVWLTTFFRADAHDLGWPTCWQQVGRDIGIGTIATLAALLPIYVIQFSLISILQLNTPHPLVKQLSENFSPAMLLLGFAMAVIAAPLFEEFTFRGLLQGWLERREDETLAFVATERQPLTLPLESEPNEATSFQLETESTTTFEPTTAPRPAHGWITTLPHGWTPILISGFAFGLAHIGHGVAPITLVLFGIVLGYLYQRTHRLVPSITAHMLFNGYSMVLLWLQLKTLPQ